jgi:hypothetical protein
MRPGGKGSRRCECFDWTGGGPTAPAVRIMPRTAPLNLWGFVQVFFPSDTLEKETGVKQI